MTMRSRSRVIIAVYVVIVSAGCNKRADPVATGPPQKKPQSAPVPPSGSQQENTQRAAVDPLPAAGADFANALQVALGERRAGIAILPFPDGRGQLTPGSDYLADRVQAALLAKQMKVMDRQSVKAAIAEIDIGAVFDGGSPAPRFAAADLLVVGRYSLAGGLLQLNLKAVDVATNTLLLLRTYELRPDARLRQLAFSTSAMNAPGEEARVEERGGAVRITATYREPHADQLRLLDRVRQRIRRVLASYLRDARGCEGNPDEVEKWYRRGTEIDCQFRDHSVTLQMEFGDIQCDR